MRHLIIEEPYSDTALWSRRLAVFAAAVIVGGLALARLHFDPTAVLAVLGSAIVIACLALLCAAAAAVAIWQTGRKGVGILLAGGLVAAFVLAYPAYLAYQAIRLPALNDISTDIYDPPSFSLSEQALAARHNFVPAPMPTALRQRQLAAYPEIQPIVIDVDGDDAYQTVLQVIQTLHWRLVEAHPPGGRFGIGHVDAIDRGFVLDFPNDITIRIRPLAGETRVDVRSVSQIGRHDFGANARRIEAFADEFKNEIEQQ